MEDVDVEQVELALDVAKNGIKRAKPTFFRRLDAAKPKFWTREDSSHKGYLVPCGPEAIKAIDEARRKIADEVEAGRPPNASGASGITIYGALP